MKQEDTKEIIIIGASGHGKVVADIAGKCGYTKIGFLDDRTDVKSCLGYPVLGKTKDYKHYQNADFFIAIGNAEIRERIEEKIETDGFPIATLIHPSAQIGSGVFIGKGTVVMAGAIINPDSRIGKGCIVNTGATIDHDNVLEDYVHISVGAHLAGTVYIGKGTWIGAGVTVSNNVSICGACMIGAGALVIKNIDTAGKYMGVPAFIKKDQ